VLYWLTRLGWSDVLLVERANLTSGSTFHSAGLVGQLRSSLPLTRMMMSSVELYRGLGDEVGLETGWREVGSLRLASSPERMEELRRQAAWAASFGLPLELISAAEAQELFPPMSTEGVLGAAYLPTDGYVDPSQLTQALAAGARRAGAEVAEGVRLTAIERDGTLGGPDVDGLATVLDATELPVIASGGVGSVADLRALAALRSPSSRRSLVGAVVGKALLDGRVGVEEAIVACAPSG
jgi:4-methylaminobutanoate oxidase (formaldehyde-forming)